MALKKNVSVEIASKNVVFENAYIRVSHVSASKAQANAEVEVQDKKNGGVIKRDMVSFTPTMDSNFIAQAYLHMKTLAEYADAEDC
jgi:hypothetical protein